MMKNFQKNQHGFTLIELLVVMAIIAVLSTIMAGNFMTSQMRARDAKRKSDLTQIQRAMEQYMNDHGTYPASDAQGRIVGCGPISSTPPGNPTACTWGGVFQYGTGCATDTQPCATYMMKLPTDSKAPASQYFYLSSTSKTQYQLFVHLENTQDSDNVSPAYAPACTIAGGSIPCLCGTTSSCTYGQSSTNTTPGTTLQ